MRKKQNIPPANDEILFAINTRRITLPLVYFLTDRLMIDIEFLPYYAISEIRIFHKATPVTTGTVEIICHNEPFFFQYGKKEEDSVLTAIDMVREKISDPLPIISQSTEGNTSTPAERAFSVADEILKFKNLLDIGAITEEEYEKEKAKLLRKR